MLLLPILQYRHINDADIPEITEDNTKYFVSSSINIPLIIEYSSGLRYFHRFLNT